MTSRCENSDKKLGRECRRVIDDLASIHDAVSFVLEYSQIRRDRTGSQDSYTDCELIFSACTKKSKRMVTRQDCATGLNQVR